MIDERTINNFIDNSTPEEIAFLRHVNVNGRISALRKMKKGELMKPIYKDEDLKGKVKTKLNNDPEMTVNFVKNSLGVIDGPTREISQRIAGKILLSACKADASLPLDSDAISLPVNSKTGLNSNAVMHNAFAEYVYSDNVLHYYDEERQEHVRLSDFDIEPICLKVHYYRNRPAETKIEFILIDGGRRVMSYEISPSEMDNLDKIIRTKYPQGRFETKTVSLRKKLADYLSLKLKNISQSVCYHYTGWEQINGKYIYLDGNNPYCMSEKKLDIDVSLPEIAAYKKSLEFLYVANDLTKILVPFLVSYLGIMFHIFQQAGHTPQFVVYMAGTTGSLKTAVSKVLYNIWNGTNSKVAASFNDTAAGIELKLGSISDEVLLVDDFRPSSSRMEEINMKQKLEQLIRYIGDDIAKARATNTLEAQKEFKHHGLVVVTGEETSGSASSLLRCIVVEVDKNSFNGQNLHEYQENSLLLPTGKYHFIKFLERNFGNMVNYIKDKFPVAREFYSAYFEEKRLVDSAAFLDVMSRILLEYGMCIEALSPLDAEQRHVGWRQAILDSVSSSQKQSKGTAPAVMYLMAIESFINNQSVSFATTQDEYCENVSRYSGFFDYEAGFLYLQHDTLYKKVNEYWRNLKKRFPLSQGQTHKELALANAIEIKGNGFERGEYLCKATINGKRQQFLTVKLKVMSEIVYGN